MAAIDIRLGTVSPSPIIGWLGKVCRRVREDRGIPQVRVAAEAGVTEQTVYRFESGRAAWPRELDAMLTAYCECCGVAEITLWRYALEEWEYRGDESNNSE